MAAAENVIIVGKLDTKELENSISKLVKTVKDGTNEMANAFEGAIGRMTTAMSGLTNAAASLNNATNERISNHKREAESVNEVKQSYDKLGQSQRQSRSNSNRDNNTFVASLIAQYDQLIAKIQEVGSLMKITMEFAQAERQATQAAKERDTVVKSTVESTKQLAAEQRSAARAAERMRTQEMKYQDNQLKKAYFDAQKMPEGNLAQMRAKLLELQRMFGVLSRYELLSPSQLSSGEAAIDKLKTKIAQLTAEEQAAKVAAEERARAGALAYDAMANAIQRVNRETAEQRGMRVDKMFAPNTELQEMANYYRQLQQSNIPTQVGMPSKQNSTIFAQMAADVQKLGKEAHTNLPQLQKDLLDIMRVGKESIPKQEFEKVQQYLKQVRSAYFGLDKDERESVMGKALKADIATLEKLLTMVSQYQSKLWGLGQRTPDHVTPENQRVKAFDYFNNPSNRDIDALNVRLEELKRSYKALSNEEKNNIEVGGKLVTQIQAINRQIELSKRSMSTPVSAKEAFGLSEKTLDDIAYKIRQLGAYRSGLNTQTQTTEIRRVTAEMDRLQKKQNELIGNNKRLIGSNTALGRSFSYIKNRLAYTVSIIASTSFVKQIYDIRSQYEMLERSIGILVDSASQGTHIFNKLNEMALKSPFTLIELGTAAKQLTAYDVAAKDVVDTTRRLADIAAAAGVPIERLTYALGQVKAYTYLNSRDARMFTNAGIPLVKQLADYYSELEGRMVSVGDVYDRIKKKQVDYNEVMAVMNKMTDEGGKYFNFQEKMADTMKVQLANLTLAYNNMLNEIGESNQALLTSPIKWLKEMMLNWRSIENVLVSVASAYGIVKAAQFAYAAMTGRTIALDKALVTTEERAALATAKRNVGVKGLTMAINAKNVATYRERLEEMKLTQTEARLIAMRNRHNVELLRAMVEMELLDAATMKQIMNMSGLTAALRQASLGLVSMAKSAKAAGLAFLSNPIGWIMTAIAAIISLAFHYKQTADQARQFSNAVAQSAKESFEQTERFLKEYSRQIDNAETYGNKAEATKLWERMAEEIEKTTTNASVYISELEQIADMQDRLEKGKGFLETSQKVDEEVQKVSDILGVTQNVGPLGLGGEGLVDDAKDFSDAYSDLSRALSQAGISLTEYNKALQAVNANGGLNQGEVAERIAKQTKAFNEDLVYQIAGLVGYNGLQPGALVGEFQEYAGEIDKSYSRYIEPAINKMSLNTAEEVTLGFDKIKDHIKAEKPEIQGAAAEVFDIRFDENFAKSFEFDVETFKQGLQSGNTFAIATLNTIRDTYSETFKNVSLDQMKTIDWSQGQYNTMFQNAQNQIIKNIEDNSTAARIFYSTLREVGGDAFKNLSNEQIANINWADDTWNEILNKTFDRIQNHHIPSAYNAVRNFVGEASKFHIDIPIFLRYITVNEGEETPFQKNFRKTFMKGEPYRRDFTNDIEYQKAHKTWEEKTKSVARFNQKKDETIPQWSKRLNEEWNTYKADLKVLEHAYNSYSDKSEERAVALKQSVDEYRQNIKNIEDIARAEGFILTEKGAHKKKTKSNKSAASKRESELAKAVKDEISILNKVTQNYQKLVKAGADEATAIAIASEGYEGSIAKINAVLSKNGVAAKDLANLKKFAGYDQSQILAFLENQRKVLAGRKGTKPDALKALDVEIEKINVDAKVYDLSKITEGLETALTKIHEEYELGVEIAADPNLAGLFGDMFGIDLSTLPNNARDAIQRMETELYNALEKAMGGEALKEGIDIDFNDMMKDMPTLDLLATDIDAFADKLGLTLDNELRKQLVEAQKTARDLIKSEYVETEKMLNDYIKKYGTYSDKVADIERTRLAAMRKLNDLYNTEELRATNEYQERKRAIERGSAKELDNLTFSTFKDSDFYVTMFENIERASTASLTALRAKLMSLRGSLNELDPKNLKVVLQQIEKIDTEVARRNPFKGLGQTLTEAYQGWRSSGSTRNQLFSKQKELEDEEHELALLKSEREELLARGELDSEHMQSIQSQIKEHEKKRDGLQKEVDNLMEQVSLYDKILKLLGEQSRGIAEQVDTQLDGLMSLNDFIQDYLKIDLGEIWNGFMDGLKLANDGLQELVSSATKGSIGGIVTGIGKLAFGVFDTIASWFGGGAAKTKRLQREIEASERAVRSLNMAYKDLERQVQKAMGAEELRARKSIIANKQAEMEEVKRQMRLEREKRKKDRDNEKINQYEERIQDLRLEIAEMVDDVANNLLGGDIKSAAEDFVSTWVDAWKEGGNVMDALSEKFDDMIETMITKSLASAMVAKRLQPIWDMINQFTNERSDGGAAITLQELQKLKALTGNKNLAQLISSDLKDLFEWLGIGRGSGNKGNLSALQQGIQSITEDTAGALEAYMNIISQRMFLHTDLLTQINNTLQAFDPDVQMATNAQMLLQLQQSYQIQVAIQNILSGWSSPNGMAVKVQMV